MWNPITFNYECNKACKIYEYLYTNNFSCKNYLFNKLVLACEDKILNTTETSVFDENVA